MPGDQLSQSRYVKHTARTKMGTPLETPPTLGDKTKNIFQTFFHLFPVYCMSPAFSLIIIICV